ncbi:MAG: hypothetical protein ACOY3I_00725 [Verrucomicrobiota bacterium]
MSILGTEAISSGNVNFKAMNLPEPVNPQEAQKLWHASQAMESLFATYMLKELDKVMPKSSANGANIYGDLFKRAVADEIAKSNSLGLSQQIYLAVDKIARQVEKTEQPEQGAVDPKKVGAL